MKSIIELAIRNRNKYRLQDGPRSTQVYYCKVIGKWSGRICTKTVTKGRSLSNIGNHKDQRPWHTKFSPGVAELIFEGIDYRNAFLVADIVYPKQISDRK